jgi:hypothetical protein
VLGGGRQRHRLASRPMRRSEERSGAAPKPSQKDVQESVAEVVASLTREQLADVVLRAADRHDDVARAVRLVAARSKGDLVALRSEVDPALRTRRFLGYWESMDWARAARPVVAELDRAARTGPSRELVELLQRAVGHVVKVIQQADDSSGLIGDLVRDLLESHAVACDAGVADPVKPSGWMIRFRFSDQDFFEVDPVRYQEALGEEGLAAYREAVEAIDDAGSFAVRHARERLAVVDRDIQTIVKLAGGDLSNPYQFFRVAEAMAELGRDDLVLEWTARGIAETSGWQVGTLARCTAWPVRRTLGSESRSRSFGCAARSTSGCPRSRPTAPCARRRRSSAPGMSSARRRGRGSGQATSAVRSGAARRW